MTPLNRAIFGGGRRALIIANLLFRLIARTAKAELSVVARRLGQGMGAPDRRTLADPGIAESYGEAVREAFRQGPGGATIEARILIQRWPFAPEEIHVPTLIWHGAEDRNVPVASGQRLADQIRVARPQVVADAGHLLFFEHAETILRDLRSAAVP